MGFKNSESLGESSKLAGGGMAKPYRFDAETIAQGEALRVNSQKVVARNYSAVAEVLRRMDRPSVVARVVGDSAAKVIDNAKYSRVAERSAKKERSTERAWSKVVKGLGE